MARKITEPDQITEMHAELLVEKLVERPVLVDASKAVGLCPLAVRRKMRNDDLFKELIEEAINVGADHIEAEAYRLAMGEETQIKTFNGKPIKWVNPDTGKSEFRTERVRSERTLLKLLTAYMPEKYGDKQEVTHKHGTGVLLIPQQESASAFEDMLKRVKQEAEEENDQFDQQGGLDAPAGEPDAIPSER